MTEICHLCRQSIRSLNDWLILEHPNRALPRAFFTHLKCGDAHDDGELQGYGIELKRIVHEKKSDPRHNDDSLQGWLDHLYGKNWFHPGLGLAVFEAHDAAVALREAGVVPAILRTAVPTTPAKPSRPRKPSSRIRDARQKITGALRRFVFARDCFKCVQCGAGAPLVIDHIMPVSHGGSAEVENLQSLCHGCNQRKGVTIP